MMPTEVNNTLVECLQYTLTLRLDGTPAADAAAPMMQVWQTTFDGLPWTWDEVRDSRRIRQAFTAFWAVAAKFPQPRDIIGSLPPIETPLPKLERKFTPEEMAENRRRLKAILNNLTKGKTL